MEDVYWIHLGQERVKWLALLKMAIKHRVFEYDTG
jgi:hypothetical protein